MKINGIAKGIFEYIIGRSLLNPLHMGKTRSTPVFNIYPHFNLASEFVLN